MKTKIVYTTSEFAQRAEQEDCNDRDVVLFFKENCPKDSYLYDMKVHYYQVDDYGHAEAEIALNYKKL